MTFSVIAELAIITVGFISAFIRMWFNFLFQALSVLTDETWKTSDESAFRVNGVDGERQWNALSINTSAVCCADDIGTRIG